MSIQNLKKNDYRIKCKSMKILVLHYSEHELVEKKLIKVLMSFTEDQDPRVRIMALELMVCSYFFLIIFFYAS